MKKDEKAEYGTMVDDNVKMHKQAAYFSAQENNR